MERIGASVPPPMMWRIDEFADESGFENRSQAIRELIWRGLNQDSNSQHFQAGDGAQIKPGPSREIELDPKEIVELYWYDDKTEEETARELSVSRTSLSKYMEEWNIPQKPIAAQRRDIPFLRWDAERLQYLGWLTPLQQDYIQRFLFDNESQTSIAEDRNVNRSTVYESINKAIQRLSEVYNEHQEVGKV